MIQLSDSPAGARVITLNGPLTLGTLFEFQTASREEHSKPVMIDISGVPYMDSAGLGSVISVFASCQRTKRAFAITGVSDRIRTLFEVTHVDGLLPCFDTPEAADSFLSNR